MRWKVVQAELAEAQTEYQRTRLRARAAEIRDQIAMNRSAHREAIRRMRGP